MNKAAKHSRLPLPSPGSALLFAAVLLPLFCTPASANTSVFTDSRICTVVGMCQTLSIFGVLTGTSNDTNAINGGWSFTGGIGVGTTDKLSKSGTNSSNDIIDFADALNSGSSCSSKNYCGSGTITGATVAGGQTVVTTAESQADSIRTQLATSTFNTGNGTVTTLAAGTATYNVESGITPGGLKVYRNSAGWAPSTDVTFGCGGTMCNANDLVVVKITGGALNVTNSITLADGLTPDQLIFYIPSNNISINPTVAGETISGDFFTQSTSGTYNFGGASNQSFSFYGRIYADDGVITFASGGGSQNDQGPNVPEPGTWAMMAGGLAAAIWFKRRHKQKQTVA